MLSLGADYDAGDAWTFCFLGGGCSKSVVDLAMDLYRVPSLWMFYVAKRTYIIGADKLGAWVFAPGRWGVTSYKGMAGNVLIASCELRPDWLFAA